jgi:hypothetical protein
VRVIILFFSFQNPGLTFDPGRKDGARRSTRFLLHTLYNLTHSIEYLDLIRLESIPTASSDDQSAHRAVKLVIHFRARSTSDRSVVAIVPPREIWSDLGSSDHDVIPHLKLIWPFFRMDDVKSEDDDDQREKILLPLRLLLAQYEPFDLEIIRTDENSSGFCPSPCSHLRELHEKIRQLFLPNEQAFRTSVMHMAVNQGGKDSPIQSAAGECIRAIVFNSLVLHYSSIGTLAVSCSVYLSTTSCGRQ